MKSSSLIEIKLKTEANMSDGGCKVYVGGLPFGIDTEDLRQHFIDAGYSDIEDAIVMKDREDPSKSRGFGFITFSSSDSASAAVKSMNNTDCGGRSLKVDHANERRSGGGGRGGGGGFGGRSSYGGGRSYQSGSGYKSYGSPYGGGRGGGGGGGSRYGGDRDSSYSGGRSSGGYGGRSGGYESRSSGGYDSRSSGGYGGDSYSSY